MTRTDRLALGAVAGVTTLPIVLVGMHAIQPGVSPVDHFVSEYAHGPIGWLVSLGYALAGAGTLVIAWRLVAWLGPGRSAVASAACLGVVGIGLVATGLTRIDVATDAGTLTSTTSGQIHELASYLSVFGLVAGAFLTPAAFRRDPHRSPGASILQVYGWAMLAALAGVLASQQLGAAGLGQRAFLGVAISWLLYVGLRVSGVLSPTAQVVPASSPR